MRNLDLDRRPAVIATLYLFKILLLRSFRGVPPRCRLVDAAFPFAKHAAMLMMFSGAVSAYRSKTAIGTYIMGAVHVAVV